MSSPTHTGSSTRSSAASSERALSCENLDAHLALERVEGALAQFVQRADVVPVAGRSRRCRRGTSFSSSAGKTSCAQSTNGAVGKKSKIAGLEAVDAAVAEGDIASAASGCPGTRRYARPRRAARPRIRSCPLTCLTVSVAMPPALLWRSTSSVQVDVGEGVARHDHDQVVAEEVGDVATPPAVPSSSSSSGTRGGRRVLLIASGK